MQSANDEKPTKRQKDGAAGALEMVAKANSEFGLNLRAIFLFAKSIIAAISDIVFMCPRYKCEDRCH